MTTDEQQIHHADRSSQLRGKLSAPAIILMVLAAAAPLSVIGGQVPLGFLLGNGVGLPAMFVLAAAILILFAVGFTHMTRFIPRTGAFFLYISFGLGRPAGLGAAYLSIFSYLCIQLGLAAYLGSVLSDSIAAAGGPGIPWWCFSLVGLVVCGTIGLRKIGVSSAVLGILLLLEIVVVLIVAFAVVAHGGAAGLDLSPFEPSNVLSGSPALGLMFALAAFLGFESTAIFRDEARDPQKTIPRATYGAVILVGLFYAFSSWAVVMAWGPENVVAAAQMYPSTLILETARIYLGPVAVAVINVLIVTSVLAAMLSFHNVVTRYLHSLSSHGLLPPSIARTRDSIPRSASLLTSGIGVLLIALCAVLGLDGATQVLAWTSGVATAGLTALMAAAGLSVIVYFRRSRVSRSVWRTLVAPALGFVGLVVGTALIIDNLPLLVGDTVDGAPAFGVTSGVLLISLIVFPVIGVVQALVVRRRSPGVYAGITEVDDSAP